MLSPVRALSERAAVVLLVELLIVCHTELLLADIGSRLVRRQKLPPSALRVCRNYKEIEEASFKRVRKRRMEATWIKASLLEGKPS